MVLRRGPSSATLTVLNNFAKHVIALRALKRAFVVVWLVRLYAREPHPPAALGTNRLREDQARRVEYI
jgi:hypothetical protein